MNFRIDPAAKIPIYKQLVSQIECALHDGSLKADEQIPSLNIMADNLGISKETVKKAYNELVARNVIVPRHGKGFFAADIETSNRKQVLVIFDKLSVYKQILFNSFAETLDGSAEVTIVNHNQNVELFEYYLDNYLDRFDYYVITPHFPLDGTSQSRAIRQISRIPNRKLIMLDRLQPGYAGNFGAVYQDFENDIYSGLMQGVRDTEKIDRLRVITLPSSLYGQDIRKGVERFASDMRMPVEFLTEAPADIHKGDTFLVLNSQLDAGLVALWHRIRQLGLGIGSDVRIISYNESDMCELVLGGLTTVSADFCKMGRLAAGMILEHKAEKVHCDFKMIRRATF